MSFRYTGSRSKLLVAAQIMLKISTQIGPSSFCDLNKVIICCQNFFCKVRIFLRCQNFSDFFDSSKKPEKLCLQYNKVRNSLTFKKYSAFPENWGHIKGIRGLLNFGCFCIGRIVIFSAVCFLAAQFIFSISVQKNSKRPSATWVLAKPLIVKSTHHGTGRRGILWWVFNPQPSLQWAFIEVRVSLDKTFHWL